jgi:MFS family permease
LNYASILGIKADTNITDKQFTWVASIFYLGYLLFQGPSMILIQKLPLSKYVGSVITIWGVVLLVTFLSKSFSQLTGLRFLLGFFEAGIYPCCIMLISALYRRKEQAGRIGLVYICNGIAMAIGGLIGYGIGHMQGIGGLAAWQWLMIIPGAITILFGIISFFFMVDNPKAKVLRLTPEELKIVESRQRDNAVVRSKEIKMSHIWEALKEPRYYIFCLGSLLINFQNSVLGVYSSMITKGFGFDVSMNRMIILYSMTNKRIDFECNLIDYSIWCYRLSLYYHCCLVQPSIR